MVALGLTCSSAGQSLSVRVACHSSEGEETSADHDLSHQRRPGNAAHRSKMMPPTILGMISPGVGCICVATRVHSFASEYHVDLSLLQSPAMLCSRRLVAR